MNTKDTPLIRDEVTEQIISCVQALALSEGAENVTVRRVLCAMGITNRVFYNRFRNLDEVLHTVYERTVLKIRESICARFDEQGDYFSQVTDIVASTLRLSYENKMHFSQYVFRSDSISHRNYEWWRAEIIRLIEFGKARGYLKNVDTEVTSYAVWCFARGYNADAIARGIPLEEAVANFRYAFSLLLDGMRA